VYGHLYGDVYGYGWDGAPNAVGKLNPLRYRGYVYDTETGLYYLQSRYYNPEWGRFITADSISYLGIDGTPTSYNPFVYCGNNPVMYSDPTGEIAISITTLIIAGSIASLISGVANALSVAGNGGTISDCIKAGLIGVGSGAVGFVIATITGFSPGGNLLARGVSSALCNLGTALVLNGEITKKDIAITAVDVTLDICFSTISYYYISFPSFTQETAVNSLVDGCVDIFESVFIYPQTEKEEAVGEKNRSPKWMVMPIRRSNYVVGAA